MVDLLIELLQNNTHFYIFYLFCHYDISNAGLLYDLKQIPSPSSSLVSHMYNDTNFPYLGNADTIFRKNVNLLGNLGPGKSN